MQHTEVELQLFFAPDCCCYSSVAHKPKAALLTFHQSCTCVVTYWGHQQMSQCLVILSQSGWGCQRIGCFGQNTSWTPLSDSELSELPVDDDLLSKYISYSVAMAL